jgi:hypothetical protein
MSFRKNWYKSAILIVLILTLIYMRDNGTNYLRKNFNCIGPGRDDVVPIIQQS